MAPEFRLVLLTNLRAGPRRDVWEMPTDRVLFLGRRGQEGAPPEVDLWPDTDVSRNHARVWYAGGQWHIEDLDSTNGTLVDGRQIKGLRSTPLPPWATIRIGSNLLMLALPGWRRLRSTALVVDFEIEPAVNLALAHCVPLGAGLISRLSVTNASEATTAEARLTFSLSPLADAVGTVPALSPGESRHLVPRLDINYEALESRGEGALVNLSALLDGRPLEGEAIACRVLAYNEWSAAQANWASLAAFVLPNNPRAVEVAAEISQQIGTGAAPEQVLARIFAHFRDSWNLSYQFEPPTANGASTAVQKIRLPHQVLDPLRRSGVGTCLDLAVLAAACLEHLHARPLIAILDTGPVLHALVGCWRAGHSGVRPICSGRSWKEEIGNNAAWVDITACVRDEPQRLDFTDARDRAVGYLTNNPLVFALDVEAARRDGIGPLPFAGEPVPSREVEAALRAADRLATEWPTRLGTVPLLLGLLVSHAPLTTGVFGACVTDVDETGRRVLERLPREPGPPPPTPRYHEVVNLACSKAKREGSPRVLERHLLLALFEIGGRSEAFGHALRYARTDLEKVRGILGQLLVDTPPDLASVFPEVSGPVHG
jgi:hypothetical protein